MMKVAVLGGNGYLGGRVAQSLNRIFETTAITRNPFQHPSCKNVDLDFKSNEFANSLKKYDVIVNCTGSNKVKTSHDQEKTLHEKKNVISSIIKASSEKNILVFHVSSKHVYSVLKDQNAKNNSISKAYAYNHLEAENFLINSFDACKGSDYRIIRLANCFGYSPTMSKEFNNLFLNQVILSNLKQKKFKINNPEQIMSFTPIEIVGKFICDSILSRNSLIEKKVDLGVPYGIKLNEAFCLVENVVNQKNAKKFLKFDFDIFGLDFLESWPQYKNSGFLFDEILKTSQFLSKNEL